MSSRAATRNFTTSILKHRLIRAETHREAGTSAATR
jgi:hypothetical protein